MTPRKLAVAVLLVAAFVALTLAGTLIVVLPGGLTGSIAALVLAVYVGGLRYALECAVNRLGIGGGPREASPPARRRWIRLGGKRPLVRSPLSSPPQVETDPYRAPAAPGIVARLVRPAVPREVPRGSGDRPPPAILAER